MRRALSSCAKHLSGVSISCDPGYPADAIVVQQLAREFGLPAHVYFTVRTGSGGSLRTTVLEEGEKFAATLGAEYVVNLDADDELAFDVGFVWPATDTAYAMIEVAESMGDKRPLDFYSLRLFRVGCGWHFIGPRHEQPRSPKTDLRTEPVKSLKGVRYVKHEDGARRPERFAEDAALLREWLKEHPDEYDFHYFFAQALHASKQYPEAFAAYNAYLEGPTTPAFVYRAAMNACDVGARLAGVTPLDVLLLISRAISMNPHRAEVWRLGQELCAYVADGLPEPEFGEMLDRTAYGKRK